jgi:hypothetical protein
MNVNDQPLYGSLVLPHLSDYEVVQPSAIGMISEVWSTGLSRQQSTEVYNYSLPQSEKIVWEKHLSTHEWTHVLHLTTRRWLKVWALRYLLNGHRELSFFQRLQKDSKKYPDCPSRIPYHVVLEYGNDVGFHAHALIHAPSLPSLLIEDHWRRLQRLSGEEFEDTYTVVHELEGKDFNERIQMVGYAVKLELIYSQIDANYGTSLSTHLVESKVQRFWRKTKQQRKSP